MEDSDWKGQIIKKCAIHKHNAATKSSYNWYLCKWIAQDVICTTNIIYSNK